MSSLVAMIVLAYLLVIAVCVALWTAVSLRRAPVSEPTPESRPTHARSDAEPRSGDRRRAASARSDTHDAYRGARANIRPAPAPAAAPAESSAPDRVRPARAVPLFSTDREPLPSAPLRARVPLDASGTELQPDAIRVHESKRTRERSSQHVADEPRKDRNTPEDAFERFLRASEDFDR